jgi:hypothetical protein
MSLLDSFDLDSGGRKPNIAIPGEAGEDHMVLIHAGRAQH